MKSPIEIAKEIHRKLGVPELVVVGMDEYIKWLEAEHADDEKLRNSSNRD